MRETEKKAHVLTRSTGRLPQAPTPALGPGKCRGRKGGRGRGGRETQAGRISGVNKSVIKR